MLPEDIIARVRRDFSKDEEIPILQLLSEYQQQNPDHSPRILRCIVFEANGNFDRFAGAVKLAKIDWRDLIMNAEYECGNNQIRNFNAPFVGEQLSPKV